MYSGDGTYSIDQMVDTGTCVEVYVEGDISGLPHGPGVWVGADNEYHCEIDRCATELSNQIDKEIIDKILEFEETEQVIGIFDLFPVLTQEPIPLINKRRLPSGFP